MRLVSNFKANQYYWVDENNVQRSPIFAYESDALNWRAGNQILKSESTVSSDIRMQLNG